MGIALLLLRKVVGVPRVTLLPRKHLAVCSGMDNTPDIPDSLIILARESFEYMLLSHYQIILSG